MTSRSVAPAGVVCLLAALVLLGGCISPHAYVVKASPDSPEEMFKWRRLSYLDEKGEIAPGGLLRAIQQRNANIQAHRTDGPSPDQIDSASWFFRGPYNVAGRTRTLLIDPRNANVMWAGSVSGGIWKSTDGGTTWTPVDDFAASLSANTLAMDPQNPNVMYCGTGEGYFNGDSITGAGILKSVDGGVTWQQLPQTASWPAVNRISISPANSSILLATNRDNGIYRSTDGGATWNHVYTSYGAFNVAFHPTDGSKAVGEILGYDSQWYRIPLYSTDGGATWNPASGLRINDWLGRIELAYAPSNPLIVYANAAVNGGKIYKSTDGGASYSLVTGGAYSTGASWYNNFVWVDPTNANLLVCGGSPIFRSTDGGASLTQIANGYILTTQPHPDSHFAVQDPGYNGTTNRRVYVTTDGGVFRATNIATASTSGGWTSLNATYASTQYYGAAGHSNGMIVGGTQDNGTLRLLTGSTDAWMTFGGDGGWCAIDPSDSNYTYGEYIYLQIHRSTDGGSSANYIYNGITDAGSGSTSNFIAPFVLDPNDSNIMFAGGYTLWRSSNVKAAVPSWTSLQSPASDKISAIAVAPGNSNIVWIGLNNGRVYKTSNALSSPPTWSVVDDNGATNPLPDRYVTRILIDPANSDVVYVSFGGFSSGNLQKTIDGGTTFNSASGSGNSALPSAPVRGIARHPSNASWIYAGTEVGIFSSVDGGTTWSAVNEGPAAVSVDELFFLPSSATLVAATYGRGIWMTSALQPAALEIDAAGNGVFEPGETVLVRPAWFDSGPTPIFANASVTSFTGPGASNYSIVDGNGSYGVAAESSAACSDCYSLQITNPASRPSAHWDAVATESLTTSPSSFIASKPWTIHVGNSFTDVPSSNVFYTFVERILHHGVTLGCTATTYCPSDSVLRSSMAAFVARAMAGGDLMVPAGGVVGTATYRCESGGISIFADVPPTDTFCRHIHYIASKGVTLGCTGSQYCPSAGIRRDQMAAFIARALAGSDAAVPSAYTDPDTGLGYDLPNGIVHFTDMGSDIFSRHAHYLWAKGIIGGCTATTYCPAGIVSRDAMAKFLANGFRLTLYGVR